LERKKKKKKSKKRKLVDGVTSSRLASYGLWRCLLAFAPARGL
jgi:hypothetical protein